MAIGAVKRKQKPLAQGLVYPHATKGKGTQTRDRPRVLNSWQLDKAPDLDLEPARALGMPTSRF